MRTKLEDWPEGTPDYTTHDQVEQYIKALAVRTGAQERIQYNTRVNLVEKYNCAGSDNSWKVHTSTLQKVGTGDGYEIVGHGWSFDAVVVCNGRYHEPRIPDLPGLREWKELYPAQVLHSKSYRSPMPFKGKNVFLLGSGVSALDIAREIVGLAKQLYRSSRNGSFDLPAGMFDPGVRTVGPVVKLVPDSQSGHGTVVLADGQAIHAIDVIILCTGYITSYPFLGDLQMPAVSKEKADERVIITSDGCTTHNLHKDIFYIPDPTLVFVGVPYHASAFSLFDFQAEVVARVLAGKAQLPSQKAMRAEYDRRRASIQAGGTAFHSLMKRDVEYMKSLQDWVNREAARLGCEPMDPINDQWVERYFHFVKEMEARRWSSQVVGQELKHAAPRAVLNHTKVNA
jgi:cation diffusion facilitator CzcD-associated flavoprotein CzcO